MAETVALRTYLREVIGLGANQDGTDRANAIIDEGLDSIASLVDLDPDNGIKTVCANVRKPSGTIPQPGWIAPVPNPDNQTAPEVAKPGLPIPALCEQRLNLAAYGARIYDQIGRDITAVALSRARLRAFKAHQTMVKN